MDPTSQPNLQNNNPPKPLPPDTLATPDIIENPEIKLSVDTTKDIELSENPDAVYHYFVASPMYAGFGDLSSPDRIYFLQDVNQMSPNLRNYLTSAETVEAIFALGKEYDLKDSQISDIGALIREFLTGKIFIKDFPTAISSKFGIDDIKAGELANKLISKSFAPIIEDVKRIQRIKFPDKIQQLQKESQSSGLTQKPSTPDLPKNMPLTQSATPATPPISATPKPIPPSTQQPTPAPIQTPVPPPVQRPPLSMSPRPDDRGLPTAQPSVLPKQIEVNKPATPPPLNTDMRSTNPLRPEPPKPTPTPLNRPEFKIPDLDALVKQSINQPGGKDLEAQKSLEAELEKVANVIDLRTQSKE